jgi:hypothetical protein
MYRLFKFQRATSLDKRNINLGTAIAKAGAPRVRWTWGRHEWNRMIIDTRKDQVDDCVKNNDLEKPKTNNKYL